ITQHIKRTIELDCRQHGNASFCEDAPSERDAGTSTAGSGGSNLGPLAAAFSTATISFNTRLCSCVGASQPVNCEEAAVTAEERQCLNAVVNGLQTNSAEARAIACQRDEIAKCMACDTAECAVDVVRVPNVACEFPADLE